MAPASLENVHRFRFLLSRRWLLFLVAVCFLSWVAWRLGEWQFHRLESRKEFNSVVRTNEKLPPAPVTDVMAPSEPVAANEEWRLVTATGVYQPDDTVVVRYRVRKQTSGINVVVPLRLPDGTHVLVDRGWMAVQNSADTKPEIPAPPAGEVTVTGFVRADGTGSSTKVSDQSTRAISSVQIAEALEIEVLEGFVQLRDETPPPATPLAAGELPELDNGPHFFYGLQWWFFGGLAIFGFFYLMFDEWRRPHQLAQSSGGDTTSAGSEPPQ